MTAPRTTTSPIRSLVLSLLGSLARSGPVMRVRRRAASIMKKLLLAGYIYVAIVLARVAARLIFGWEV